MFSNCGQVVAGLCLVVARILCSLLCLLLFKACVNTLCSVSNTPNYNLITSTGTETFFFTSCNS